MLLVFIVDPPGYEEKIRLEAIQDRDMRFALALFVCHMSDAVVDYVWSVVTNIIVDEISNFCGTLLVNDVHHKAHDTAIVQKCSYLEAIL
jgi:hypothetical protein